MGEKEEKRRKQRGSDIKSGECDNSNNIINKVTRLRHKLESKEITMNH